MPIHHRKKVYLVHPARCGGTSIESALFDDASMDGRDTTKPKEADFYGDLDPAKGFSQHFTPVDMGVVPTGYTFVMPYRDPLQRAISMHGYLCSELRRPLVTSYPEVLALLPLWTRPQTDYLHNYHCRQLFVSICDGKRVNVEELERLIGGKIEHRNADRFPMRQPTAEERQFIRLKYAKDYNWLSTLEPTGTEQLARIVEEHFQAEGPDPVINNPEYII